VASRCTATPARPGCTSSKAPDTATWAPSRRAERTTRGRRATVIVVDHFLWHQHFNDDPAKTAKVVRIHMFDSLLDTMKALMDPMVLFEEPPEQIRDAQAGDISSIEWPALERPTWP